MMTILSNVLSNAGNVSKPRPTRLPTTPRLTVVFALLTLVCLPLHARSPRQQTSDEKQVKTKKIKEFSSWPAGSSPQEIGKRVTERYLSSTYLNLRRTPPGKYIIYPETCTWYG